MLGQARQYTGIPKWYLDDNPATSEIGKIVRREDARKLIQHIQQAESEVQAREQELAQVTNTIDRMMAEHRLNMDFMVSFGVRAEHRAELLAILAEVQNHGALTVQESIDLANARGRVTSPSN